MFHFSKNNKQTAVIKTSRDNACGKKLSFVNLTFLMLGHAPTYIFRSNGEDVWWSIRNVKLINESYVYNRCLLIILILVKLKWLKNMSVYDLCSLSHVITSVTNCDLYGTPSLSYVNLFNYMWCNLHYIRCKYEYPLLK